MEFKLKNSYDYLEQLLREISDISLHNSLIPRCFSEVHEMFSDLIKHPHMSYSFNRRIDEPASTPLVLTKYVDNVPGGADVVRSFGGIIPAPTAASVGPGTALGGGGTGGDSGAGGVGSSGQTGPVKIGVTVDSVFTFSAGGLIAGGIEAINDSRFKVFEVGTDPAGIYQVALTLVLGASTVAVMQVVPASVDNSVDLSKILAMLRLSIKNPVGVLQPVFVEFQRSSAIKLKLTADPGFLSGTGDLQVSDFLFEVV